MICQGPDCEDDATRRVTIDGKTLHVCRAHHAQAQRYSGALRPKRLPHGALAEGGTQKIHINLYPHLVAALEEKGPTLNDAVREILTKWLLDKESR